MAGSTLACPDRDDPPRIRFAQRRSRRSARCTRRAAPLPQCITSPSAGIPRRPMRPSDPGGEAIPHGLDTNEYPFNERPDSAGYLFDIGRITWVKGQDSAVDVAKKSGSKLALCASCVQGKSQRTRRTSNAWGRVCGLVVDVGRHPVDRSYSERRHEANPVPQRTDTSTSENSTTAAKDADLEHRKGNAVSDLVGQAAFGMVLMKFPWRPARPYTRIAGEPSVFRRSCH